MIASLELDKKEVKIDLSQGIDISMPIRASKKNPTAWYVDPPKIEAVKTEQFVGSVKEGGSVNFRTIFFNPHGHGTHTECVGHISEEVYSVNKMLTQFFYWAELISVKPVTATNGDLVITKELLVSTLHAISKETKALVIRTIPNEVDKLEMQYSNTNPAYLDKEAMQYIVDIGIDHLLIDLPSVDREVDGGELAAHHIFWNYPSKTQFHKTITEMVYISNTILDGTYLLNLQIASFENDASPSKPVLYKPINN